MATASDQFSATSNENNIINKDKDIVKSEQHQLSYSNSESLLNFINFSENDFASRSKVQEYDFFSPSKNLLVGSSSSKSGNHEDRDKKSSNMYSCNFCKNQFSSAQALGGHQNAHKKERALIKHNQEIHDSYEALHRSFPYYTNYPSLSTIPYHGFRFRSYNKALGVNMESMIHKSRPKYSWNPPPFKPCSTSVWTPMQEMKTFSFLDGMKNESVNINNGNSETPTLRNFLENLEVGVGESLMNITTKSNSSKENSIIVGICDYHNHPTNVEEISDAESVELDLSLKL